jgi:NADPH:quinone reductase-like Zn-dependent oxidoreductase
MKAFILNNTGEVNQLQLSDLPMPVIQQDEVLVQVKAISINPVDVKSRQGKGMYGLLKDHDPLILGWDIAGVVTESKSGKFKTGDEVFGMVNFPGHGKGYAEYVAAPAAHLALKPGNLSFAEAAAATLVALTSWQALVDNAAIKQGQRVLIHAAAGGVGHLAVQLAKHLGANVTGTSSAKNKELVMSFGADAHIDYHNYNWKDHPDEFDFVLDTIGGDNIDKSILVTKSGGTIISIPSGLNAEVTEKAKLKGIKGYFILVKSNGDQMQEIAGLLKSGVLKPLVSASYDFEHMHDAHLQVESGRTVGKVVVTL